jgi:hypothetical protein
MPRSLARLWQICLKLPTADRSSAAGITVTLRGPKKSAGNSERRRPPIPIELGQGWSRPAVAPSFRAGVLISIFDRLGVKFLAPGGGIARAGAYGTPNRMPGRTLPPDGMKRPPEAASKIVTRRGRSPASVGRGPAPPSKVGAMVSDFAEGVADWPQTLRPDLAMDGNLLNSRESRTG